MKRTHIAIVFAAVLTANLTTGCTSTVRRTRVVPVYATQTVAAGPRVAQARGERVGPPSSVRYRRVQVGTRTETYTVRRIDWGRTAAAVILVPVLFFSFIISSLG